MIGKDVREVRLIGGRGWGEESGGLHGSAVQCKSGSGGLLEGSIHVHLAKYLAVRLECGLDNQPLQLELHPGGLGEARMVVAVG